MTVAAGPRAQGPLAATMAPMQLTPVDLARLFGGRLEGNGDVNTALRAVEMDSRKATQGSVFVALRGEHQDGFSDVPVRGERFHVWLAALRPTSELKGMRRARDLAQQIVRTLARLEQSHFDDRK